MRATLNAAGELVEVTELIRAIPATVEEWRDALRELKDRTTAANILRRLIVGKIECTPQGKGKKAFYQLKGEGTLLGAFPHIGESRWGRQPSRVHSGASFARGRQGARVYIRHKASK